MPSETHLPTLFAVHRGELVRYASRILGDASQAEDVVQEAYLRFRAAAETQHVDEPLAYLYRVVRNLSLDFGRRLTRERQSGETWRQQRGEAGDEQPSAERHAAGREELELLARAVDELPERMRNALHLHRVEGCTFQQVADRLGVSVGLAHSLVTQALEHCRVRLHGNGDDGRE